MIGKAEGYCLAPHADGYWALSLGRGDGNSYRVNWLESMAAGRPGATPHGRELARASRRALLLLPNDSCQLIHARLPEMKPQLLRLAVLGLVRKQRGGSEQQWVVDVMRRSSGKAAGTRPAVTGLALERPSLVSLLEPLAPLDLRPGQALPQALALDVLLRRELALSDPETGAWNLVFLGREDQYLVIGDTTGPLLVRTLPSDLSGGADRSEYLERLLTEIERSHFFAQQGDHAARVQRVLVCGDPELAEPLVLRLGQSDGPVAELWQPERRFIVDGAAAAWEFLPVLAGAAAALEGAPFNVMPPRRQDGAGWRVRHYLATGGAALALGLLPLLGGGGELTRRVQAGVIDSQSVQLEHGREAAEETARAYLQQLGLLARQQQIDRYSPQRLPLGGLLRDLAARIPGAVQLVDLDLLEDEAGAYSLVLRGECRGESGEAAQNAFLRFHDALADSPYLDGGEEPETLQIDGERDERGVRSRVTFTLRYHLSPEARG
ncbi:MAG: hypothetical protein R3C71_11830 [Candidatus Krumholzibacteriia bacterium]|nr:hypothetical protein [Candidatus Latescibacterota bacterium]